MFGPDWEAERTIRIQIWLTSAVRRRERDGALKTEGCVAVAGRWMLGVSGRILAG
jgi:hypothetical protein